MEAIVSIIYLTQGQSNGKLQAVSYQTKFHSIGFQKSFLPDQKAWISIFFIKL